MRHIAFILDENHRLKRSVVASEATEVLPRMLLTAAKEMRQHSKPGSIGVYTVGTLPAPSARYPLYTSTSSDLLDGVITERAHARD